jgi:hypothetical protein
VRQTETREGWNTVARKTQMPSEEELPDGPRRKFVTELRRYWRAAGRPPLREISQAIEGHPDPRLDKVTASAETIRRMITGKVLPVGRDRVYAVFHVLCEMSKIDPDAARWTGEYDDRYDDETNWQHLQGLWDAALEEDDNAPSLPRPTPPPAPVSAPSAWPAREDPWASGGGYSDEPPF